MDTSVIKTASITKSGDLVVQLLIGAPPELTRCFLSVFFGPNECGRTEV